MKHCTLPTLLAVKTTILPTVLSSRAGKNGKNSETGKVCIASCKEIIYINNNEAILGDRFLVSLMGKTTCDPDKKDSLTILS